MYRNIWEGLIDVTGSLIIWLLMALGVVILVGLILIVTKAIIQGIVGKKEGNDHEHDKTR